MTQLKSPQVHNPFDQLRGQVAVVTGGGGGLGAEIARALSEVGVRVVIADVRLGAAERLASELRDSGGDAQARQLDVSDESSTAGFVKSVLSDYGQLDILINNAGTDVTLPLEELSVADWDRVNGVNLRGPFLLMHAAYPHMKGRGRGHIVNITSTAAKRTWANASLYHASKWGLLGLSHAMHVEARAHGVKVTAVVAGGMRTPFILDRFPDTPLENLQDPRNVAEAVRFVLTQPAESVIPELTVIPMRETSWP